MVGVSALGICEEEKIHGDIPGMMLMADFTNLERLMLDAILAECGNCIASEGADCMLNNTETSCPFVEVRKACGIGDLNCWRD